MIELKEYQKEAIENVEDKFNSGINKTCVIWPPSIGKTCVPINLMKKHLDKRFLIVAPRHSILNQTKCYMGEERLNNDKKMFYTYDGLSKMNENVMKKLMPDYIILDEVHRAGAAQWGQGIDKLWEMYPEAKTLGLTATPMRMDKQDIVKEKFNGDIAHQITLEEATARGLLKMPVEYINAVYSIHGEIADIEKSIERIHSTEEKQKLEEKLEIVKRKLQKSKGLPEIFAERMNNKSGKYIVFCSDINNMHEMIDKADEWFKGVNSDINVYTISSEKNSLENERELRDFKTDDSKNLKLLYSVDMFNEGLHIENSGIIMLRPTSSWIIYVQQLGRTLGIEKSGQIFDIVNNSRNSKDVYQFYSSVKSIQKREAKERKGMEEIDFTIYDEIRDIRDVLEEMKESINISRSAVKEKIEIFKGLKAQGKDLSKVKLRDILEDGTHLGGMIHQLRIMYTKRRLTEEEIKQIEELGIDLKPQKEKGFTVKEKIDILGDMKEQGEDLSQIELKYISEDGFPVGAWISKLRQSKRKGQLTEEEIKQLEELGIDLNLKITYKKPKRRPISNAEKIKTLKSMKEQEKGLEDETVRYWISKFKQQKKEGQLTEEEIKQLEELGVDWNMKKISKPLKNSEKIVALSKMKEQGKDLSKTKTRDGVEGNWIHYFRKLYKQGKLTEEEIKQLEGLGIKLSIKDAQREKINAENKLEQVKQLYKQYEVVLEENQKKNEEK